MYVCICSAVSDTTIQQEVENGAKDLKSLVERLDLGKGCARCVAAVKDILEDQLLKIEAAEAIAIPQSSTSLACKAA